MVFETYKVECDFVSGKKCLSTELVKRFIIHIKETSKQTLSVPQITILFVSSQYKTPELLPEILTSSHEDNNYFNAFNYIPAARMVCVSHQTPSVTRWGLAAPD